MSETLRILREEHGHLAKLLDIVDDQLAAFERGDSVDYEVFDLILDYCRAFPDRFHHPKEDLILERMRAKEPALAASFETIEGEHRMLAQETERFAEAVGLIEQEAQMSREQFLDLGRAFSGAYRRHMAFEDEAFFPAAERALSDRDWSEIDAHLHRPDDPLFEEEADSQYQRLRDILFG